MKEVDHLEFHKRSITVLTTTSKITGRVHECKVFSLYRFVQEKKKMTDAMRKEYHKKFATKKAA